MTYPGFDKIIGWCPAAKADRLESAAKNARVVVEIGVFGGQSFFAMGWSNPKAKLYAIDPWTAADAVQIVAPDAEKAFNWDDIYQTFLQDLKRYGLERQTTVLRIPSDLAITFIREAVDLLHIDGNHDAERVMSDVQTWLPKMAEGGMIVLDDVNWPSVAPAADWLRNRCKSSVAFATWEEFKV